MLKALCEFAKEQKQIASPVITVYHKIFGGKEIHFFVSYYSPLLKVSSL